MECGLLLLTIETYLFLKGQKKFVGWEKTNEGRVL
jgi:hypothetical protein